MTKCRPIFCLPRKYEEELWHKDDVYRDFFQMRLKIIKWITVRERQNQQKAINFVSLQTHVHKIVIHIIKIQYESVSHIDRDLAALASNNSRYSFL